MPADHKSQPGITEFRYPEHLFLRDIEEEEEKKDSHQEDPPSFKCESFDHEKLEASLQWRVGVFFIKFFIAVLFLKKKVRTVSFEGEGSVRAIK